MKRNIFLIIGAIFLILNTCNVSITARTGEDNATNIEENNESLLEINTIINSETGTVEGYVKWGNNNLPEGVIPGSPVRHIDVAIYRGQSHNVILWIWTGLKSTTDENGYFKIEGISLGRQYLSGQPWIYSAISTYSWYTWGRTHYLSGESEYFTMEENDPKNIQRNIVLSHYTYDSIPSSVTYLNTLANSLAICQKIQNNFMFEEVKNENTDLITDVVELD